MTGQRPWCPKASRPDTPTLAASADHQSHGIRDAYLTIALYRRLTRHRSMKLINRYEPSEASSDGDLSTSSELVKMTTTGIGALYLATDSLAAVVATVIVIALVNAHRRVNA